MEDATMSREVGAEEDLDYGSMRRNVVFEGSHLHQEHIIYRVPPLLRNGKEAAFNPHIVSIGPYHRKMQCVGDMKEHKKRYLSSLLSRKPPSGASFDDLAKLLAGKENETRRCYHENVNLIRSEFVEMMCLDGCFIVELFLKISEREHDDLFTGPMWRPRNILRDILLLENQLPFFVLKEIFLFVKPNEDPTKLVEHCLQIFAMYEDWINSKTQATDPKDIYHLLHLFHKHILPKPYQPLKTSESLDHASKPNDLPLFHRNSSSTSVSSTLLHSNSRCSVKYSAIQIISRHVNSMPCATALEENRVKLKRRAGDSFLEIAFKHRVLEIPYLWVDDHTETMFRNFIAFEQCCLKGYDNEHQFSAYVRLLDSIVNTQKDVEVLRRARIMEHGLGSDKEVALLFNNLNKGVIVNLNSSYLSDVFTRVDEHCDKIHNRWIADFKHRYFKSPWACLAMAAAVLGLSLTILTALINVSNYVWFRMPRKH